MRLKTVDCHQPLLHPPDLRLSRTSSPEPFHPIGNCIGNLWTVGVALAVSPDSVHTFSYLSVSIRIGRIENPWRWLDSWSWRIIFVESRALSSSPFDSSISVPIAKPFPCFSALFSPLS